MEDWKLNKTLSGTPQGSILSPVLANILLSKLDRFVEVELMPQYNRGKGRRTNQEYSYLINRALYLRKRKGQKEAARKLKQQAQKLPSRDPQDPDYRRLRYIRYADDFALAFIGPKKEAEVIKQHLRTVLLEELKLNLSEEKTLITHTRDSAAKFLNYEITTLQSDTKQSLTNGHKRRSINGVIGLKVPKKVVEDKCKRYMRKGKPTHRAELLNESDYTIVATYQLEYRGLVNYYRMAYNLHTLQKLKWIMETSLTKTLAHKHKTSVRKVHKKYQAELDVNGKKYKGLQVMVPREGKKPLVATWGGIPLTWDVTASIEDEIERYHWKRSELEQRLLAQVCEQCGATRMTAKIEVHHIRALKDLEQYDGREKPQWVQIMAARRRKTLVLCHTCHVDIQHGRPPRRNKVSRSRT
jgi:hypothetical protein